MSDKGQGDSLQGTPTPSPPPCANGCGFFGSASTMNMCSKCFRECQKSPSPAAAAAAASSSPASSSSPSPSAVSSPVVPASPAPPSSSTHTPIAVPIPVPAAVVDLAAADEDNAAPPPRKVQKNTSRCFSCRKKVGLTGFKCHCGYVYCATHRYSDQHDCDFDYQTSGRQQLAKANPVVIASKLDKI